MNNNDIYIAHSIFVNKGVYALFLGSGISRASGIPTGWDITKDMIERVALIEKQECGTEPDKWYKKYFNEEADYSIILEKLTHSQEERINLLRPYFEPNEDELEQGLKKPTQAHRMIAQLVKRGYIRVIITTNFDRLLENALKDVGVEPTVISNPAHVENTIPLIHSNITIVKINGDYLDTKFLNIKTELSKYDDQIHNLLRFIFENFGLLVSGWSARYDLGLVEILRSANKFRYGSFFTFVSGPETEITDLAAFRQGKLIKIESADALFTEIFENIEALEKNDKHPLTKELSIARLKKYIVREDLKIQLNDLLENEVEGIYKQINDEVVLAGSKPEEIKSNLDFFVNRCDTLISMLIEGVYWGKEYHHSLWIKVIKKIASPKDRTFSNASIIQYFPSLYLLYGAGLTAVLQRDFSLLQKLFNFTAIDVTRQKEKPIILYNYPSNVVAIDVLNKAFGNTQQVPMSEFFHRQLKPKFSKVIPTEQEYDDLFDNFEILFAFYFLKLSGNNWAPLGRFKYRYGRDTAIDRIEEEFKNKQDKFELIKYGQYKDFDELLKNYKILFDYMRERD